MEKDFPAWVYWSGYLKLLNDAAYFTEVVDQDEALVDKCLYILVPSDCRIPDTIPISVQAISLPTIHKSVGGVANRPYRLTRHQLADGTWKLVEYATPIRTMEAMHLSDPRNYLKAEMEQCCARFASTLQALIKAEPGLADRIKVLFYHGGVVPSLE